MKVQPRPARTERALSFVERPDGTGEAVYSNHLIYEPCPEADALRDLRHDLCMSLREAAATLGVGLRELCRLERGEAEPEGGWEAVFEALRTVRGVA